MGNKGRLSKLFHNEFIKSLAGWTTIFLVAIGMLKFIIQFYSNNEISVTFLLAEILIAAVIDSAILSILTLAKAGKTRKRLNILADLTSNIKDGIDDVNSRLKTIEDIEEKKFKLK